jgi:dihydrofolate reductase/thymidylate synthase
MLKIIFAISNKGDFCSRDRTSLPWGRVPEDLKFFRTLTVGQGNNAVIMGKNTFASIGHKPFPNRTNIVVSNTLYNDVNTISTSLSNTYYITPSLTEAIKKARKLVTGDVFIIGGLDILKEALHREDIDYIYVTIISGRRIDQIPDDSTIKFEYTTPASNILKSRTLYESDEYSLLFHEFWNYKLNSEEEKITGLIKNVLENGKKRIDRTSVGTIGLFAQTFRLDISTHFPLLTSKRVFWKGVVEELLWFLRGSSDTKELEEKGVNIWKGNTSREFLDSRGLTHYREGELGPGYGYQWRSFGKKYYTLDEERQLMCDGYKQTEKRGVDQIAEVIRMLREDRYSRRILVSAWNVIELENMALPPCHYAFQFYADGDDLSILVNMRSCDIFLGLPFNIASYALLTYLIAKMVDMRPKEMVFMLGDAHIYSNHIEQCYKLLERPLRELPTVIIKEKKEKIEDYQFEDIELLNYNPHPIIKADMAV